MPWQPGCQLASNASSFCTWLRCGRAWRRTGPIRFATILSVSKRLRLRARCERIAAASRSVQRRLGILAYNFNEGQPQQNPAGLVRHRNSTPASSVRLGLRAYQIARGRACCLGASGPACRTVFASAVRVTVRVTVATAVFRLLMMVTAAAARGLVGAAAGRLGCGIGARPRQRRAGPTRQSELAHHAAPHPEA